MALPFLEREARGLLAAPGRESLRAIGLTDDGGTIYVHLFPKEGSPKGQGRAFVLAWEDYAPEGSPRLACYRWLVGEARQSLRENVEKIARWLEGK